MGSIMERPVVFIVATPATGHMLPMHTMAEGLLALGFDITIVGPEERRLSCEASGVSFISIPNFKELDAADVDILFPRRQHCALGPEQVMHDAIELFVGMMPMQFQTIQTTVQTLRLQHPGRKIVMISESCVYATTALKLGAPGPAPDAIISIGTLPVTLCSKDAPFFGSGLPIDNSSEGQAKNLVMNEQMLDIFSPVQQAYNKALLSLGAKESPYFMFDAPYYLTDVFLQGTIPELEYPRSDAPETLKFIGMFPKPQKRAWASQPPWWNEVTTRNKSIVFVCQGTVSLNYANLILPTIAALADQPDVLLVVALGHKDATVPTDVVIPSNVRIIDYLPFQEILPFVDVFVTNAGYGGVQQSVLYGVPMVVAGMTEDKSDVCARVAWSGCGINLQTNVATAEQVKTAVVEVLGNDKYKLRVMELVKQVERMDAIQAVANEIEAVHSRTPI